MRCPAAAKASLCILTWCHTRTHTQAPTLTLTPPLTPTLTLGQTIAHRHTCAICILVTCTFGWNGDGAFKELKATEPASPSASASVSVSVLVSASAAGHDVCPSVSQTDSAFRRLFPGFVPRPLPRPLWPTPLGWHLCTFPFAIVISFFVRMHADGPKRFAARFCCTQNEIRTFNTFVSITHWSWKASIICRRRMFWRYKTKCQFHQIFKSLLRKKYISFNPSQNSTIHWTV